MMRALTRDLVIPTVVLAVTVSKRWIANNVLSYLVG